MTTILDVSAPEKVSSVDDDRGAFGRKKFGCRAPHAAAGTGDDTYLALEPVAHVSAPLTASYSWLMSAPMRSSQIRPDRRRRIVQGLIVYVVPSRRVYIHRLSAIPTAPSYSDHAPEMLWDIASSRFHTLPIAPASAFFPVTVG